MSDHSKLAVQKPPLRRSAKRPNWLQTDESRIFKLDGRWGSVQIPRAEGCHLIGQYQYIVAPASTSQLRLTAIQIRNCFENTSQIVYAIAPKETSIEQLIENYFPRSSWYFVSAGFAVPIRRLLSAT